MGQAIDNYTTKSTHRIRKDQYLHEVFACKVVDS